MGADVAQLDSDWKKKEMEEYLNYKQEEQRKKASATPSPVLSRVGTLLHHLLEYWDHKTHSIRRTFAPAQAPPGPVWSPEGDYNETETEVGFLGIFERKSNHPQKFVRRTCL